jgi:hypothetical protein
VAWQRGLQLAPNEEVHPSEQNRRHGGRRVALC